MTCLIFGHGRGPNLGTTRDGRAPVSPVTKPEDSPMNLELTLALVGLMAAQESTQSREPAENVRNSEGHH
jgi:hypothetical protein